MRTTIFVIALCLCFASAFADIPVHCLFNTTIGDWDFHLGPSGFSGDIDCSKTVTPASTLRVTLKSPNIAVDRSGNQGTWTLMYDEGFEVVINKQKFFAFFKYSSSSGKVISHCDQTFNGWYHEIPSVGVAPSNWGCYYATKASSRGATTEYTLDLPSPNARWVNDKNLIDEINEMKTTWTATAYPEFEGKTYDEMRRMAGGRVISEFKRQNRFKAAEHFPLKREPSNINLPTNWDWRNANGVNYVSPVRNQGSCGSCYIYAALGMLESRVRIMSNNQRQEIYSTQNPVSCSQYSQGCDGGFSILVGKFGEDYGQVLESCFPYRGTKTSCSNKCKNPELFFNTDYKYVGGFYGACSEEAMMEEVYAHGPVAVSFYVYNDFFNYRGGIYRHSKKGMGLLEANGDPKPWVEVNHAVLLVGWGVEESTNTKYWIVKNSWGESWGEKGYFRILRGVDECGIESSAEAVTPVM